MPEMLIENWKTEATEIPEKCIDNYCIRKKKVKAGESWTMEEEFKNVFGYNSVYFAKPAIVTGLEEKGKIWMTDSPREYYAMWELNARVKPKSKVLIGGLGLGILPNLLAKRKDIDEITVVEKQKEVVDLVKNHIHPKVKIIHNDIFDFIENTKTCPDTIVLDIYSGKEDIDDVEWDIETIKTKCPHSELLVWNFQPELERREIYKYWAEINKMEI